MLLISRDNFVLLPLRVLGVGDLSVAVAKSDPAHFSGKIIHGDGRGGRLLSVPSFVVIVGMATAVVCYMSSSSSARSLARSVLVA